jgi:hypothetical protein
MDGKKAQATAAHVLYEQTTQNDTHRHSGIMQLEKNTNPKVVLLTPVTPGMQSYHTNKSELEISSP